MQRNEKSINVLKQQPHVASCVFYEYSAMFANVIINQMASDSYSTLMAREFAAVPPEININCLENRMSSSTRGSRLDDASLQRLRRDHGLSTYSGEFVPYDSGIMDDLST